MVRFSPLLLTLSVASAGQILTPRQNYSGGIARKVIVGAPGQILSYTYDGTSFGNVANVSQTGTAPSWMIFKHPNLLYAVDENSNETRVFNYNPLNDTLSAKPVSVGTGSSGVVSLAFDKNKTHLIGGSYSEGQVDIWDISDSSTLKLLKQVPLTGPVNAQGVHRAHQIVPDPTGQFFAIADLGGDAIHFLDSTSWEIVSSVSVQPAGAGPRHGAFIGGGHDKFPTHYVVACELKSLVNLYEVEKTADGKVNLTSVQSLSSYGDAFPPANATSAAAGELVVARNQRDIYVSNRLSGNETDSIAHFQFKDGKIAFVDQVSSGGLIPRQFSLSADDTILFSTNQNGANGLVAFKRDNGTGTLQPQATLANSLVNTQATYGPQFVQEIPIVSDRVEGLLKGLPAWINLQGH
jgi:6-phosphogluconolactonase (cycloisomerase 2 family)